VEKRKKGKERGYHGKKVLQKKKLKERNLKQNKEK